MKKALLVSTFALALVTAVPANASWGAPEGAASAPVNNSWGAPEGLFTAILLPVLSHLVLG